LMGADKRALTKRAKYLLADAMSLATERLSSAPRRDKREEGEEFRPDDIANKAFVFIEEAARVLQREYTNTEAAEVISAFEAALSYYSRDDRPAEEVRGIGA
jgi:hypothetical protein